MKILDELFVKLQPGNKVQIKNYEKLPYGWVHGMIEECAGKTFTVNSIITYENEDYPCFLVEESGWCFSYRDIAKIEKRAESLYYIENHGCDDITHGLVRIPDEHLLTFITFITNLNKNSQYGCMPTIDVYRITDESLLREAVGPNEDNDGDDPSDILYLDDKKYVLTHGTWTTGFKTRTKTIIFN